MKAARVVPSAVTLAAAAGCVAAIVLHASASAGGPRLRFADMVVGVSFPAAAMVVLRHDPRNRAGWLMTGSAVVAAGPLLNQVAWHLLGRGAVARGGARAVGDTALWLANWVWAPYLLLPTLLVLLLPAGHIPGPRWVPVAWASVGSTTLAAVAAMFRPGGSDQIASLDNPLGLAGGTFLGPLEAVGAGVCIGILGPLCVGGLFVRQRRAEGKQRSQLQWLAAGAVGAVAGLAGAALVPWPLQEVLLAVGLLLVPGAIVVAVWRYQLFDVEVVLNRAVVSVALTFLAVGAYALLLVVAGSRLAPAAAAAATLVAAAAFGRAQRLTRRLLYGSRDQPYTVVERLGDRLAAVAAPKAAIEGLVETVRDALRLPYVAVIAADPALGPVEAGRAVAGVEKIMCVSNGVEVAELVVGYRDRTANWRSDERSLLTEMARRAAALVQMTVVLRDLENARSRVVAAREEERKRLRRELHDGIASALSGICLQLECLADDVAPAHAVALNRVTQRTAQVAAEVRILVDDLRPPALESLGLAEAVREHAFMWERRRGDGSVLVVDVVAGPLPPLAAAVELAAYRIATEAVTNAGRHARASRCDVRFTAEARWLIVEIADDGAGFAATPPGGVGLSAMRERAAEVGGDIVLTSVPGSGTRVRARLPVEAA